jgi:hypothetical protein
MTSLVKESELPLNDRDNGLPESEKNDVAHVTV